MTLSNALYSLAALFAFVSPALAQPAARGIPNFQQVDQWVFRGAQPTSEGFAFLAKLGVKRVVDLRESGARSKAEEKLVTADGMTYVNVPMTGLKAPTAMEVAKILGILEDAAAGPVFVHCKRGADRTGAVIAAYRIDHNGWDNTRALQEARALGMSPFQLPRQAFISAFQPTAIQANSAPKSSVATAMPALILAPTH